MKLTSGDKQVVQNLRFKFKERAEQYSDEQLAQAWRNFSISEDFPDEERVFDWIEGVNQ